MRQLVVARAARFAIGIYLTKGYDPTSALHREREATVKIGDEYDILVSLTTFLCIYKPMIAENGK